MAITHLEASQLLGLRDPDFARLVQEAGPIEFRTNSEGHFAALVRAITYQQLAGPAARTIHGRLLELLHHDVRPETVREHSAAELHDVGLSKNKAASVLDLAARVLDGTVELEPDRLAELNDDEVIEELVTVHGIGPWTAEIFLMINLGRLDVLPAADLGVRKGYGLAWGIPTPTPKEFEALTEKYRPYRSVLVWYCWRAADLYGRAPARTATTDAPVSQLKPKIPVPEGRAS